MANLAIHLFSTVGGIECHPVPLNTYGLERLAMFIQGIDNVYEQIGLVYRKRLAAKITQDIFQRAEVEFSGWNFEIASTEMLLRHFEDAEKCRSA